MPYEQYLLTAHWRKRRDQALRLAGWKCSLCASKNGLEVHHQTYERLWREDDGDLVVLCSTCHERHHLDEDQRSHLGVYIKLVSEALRLEDFSTFADLSDVVKKACALLKIPYNADRIARAVELVGNRKGGIFVDAPRPRPLPRFDTPEGQPVSHADAVAILKQFLGVKVGLKSMPRPWSGNVEPADRQRTRDIRERELDEASAKGIGMRTWTRSTRRQSCGRCGASIAEGAAIMVISFPGRKIRERIRCAAAACSESIAPPDLPAAVERPGIEPSRLTRVGDLVIPFDFKQASTGERDE